MVPYFSVPDIPWLPLSPFSLLVLTGFLAGIMWSVHQGRQVGVSAREVVEMGILVVIPAYLGSHILMLVLYYPQKLLQNPSIMLNFDQGLSSIGGLVTAVLAFYIYLALTGNRSRWLVFGDVLMQGFIVGWIFGRLGCTLIHDHPGILTDFFLAVPYPDGMRHDLGFYEFLYTLFVLFPVSVVIAKKHLPAGTQLAVFFQC